jgi:hypothetical protein
LLLIVSSGAPELNFSRSLGRFLREPVDHFFEALAAKLNMVSITMAESSELSAAIGMLARIIHIFEDNKSLLCYKHVDKTMFAATKEASECLTIAQHSVCCSREFFASLSWPISISARGVPTAEPCC